MLDPKGLSEKQIEFARKLANPDNSRMSIKDICEEVGIARSTFYREWLCKEEFTEYVNKLIDKYSDAELGNVWKALIEECKKGNIQAIKLYFELKGKYKQQIDLSGGVVVIAGEDKLE